MKSGRCTALLGLLVVSCFLSAQQKMRVANSVPLPEIWNKLGSSDPRASCGDAGDFVMTAVALLPEPTHEIVHIAGNGVVLDYFDFHQTPGFEKALILDAALDSTGRIVLFVANVSEVIADAGTEPPNGWQYVLDHTMWVVTVDGHGKPVKKFSFDRRLINGQYFALFNSGNVLITGRIFEGRNRQLVRTGAILFSSTGTVLADLPVSVTIERGPDTLDYARPISGGGNEVFLAHPGSDSYLRKVSQDGRLGPKVKLQVPDDERAYVLRIAGHRALASISSATRLTGTGNASEWKPMAEFDTETGALLDTILAPRMEMAPICYSDSGMTFIGAAEGTLDLLVPQTVEAP
jgi:hypothetical protein